MRQFDVTGMSCAACSARIEKAVGKVPGVTSCAVSLLTNSMGVEGSADDRSIIAAVEAAGYGAKAKGGESSASRTSSTPSEDALADRETPALLRRLLASVGFLLVLMYLSMGHMMWGWPLPGWLAENHVAMGLAEMILAAIIMVINQRFFISGFKSLLHGAPNMDTLVAMGSSVSFVWSVYILFAMTGAVTAGDQEAVTRYMMEFYFESAAMILTLITVGKMLEARSKGKTTDALKSLMKLAPKKAVLLENGKEITVPVERVKIGDVFVVRPGESVPVDGTVLSGTSAVNEASLTGESIPVDKGEGDPVSAATINESGFLTCRATRVGEDTTLAQIIRMVSDAAATKAPIAKIADKVSGVFVPAVLGVALVTTVIWLCVGAEFADALSRGIAVLVISCPCALGLATPVAIMVGNGVGARNGILFKTAVSLEETGRVQIVALDKTGTITEGTPHVTDVIPASVGGEETLLSLARTLEEKSEHPLAKAVVAYAEEKKINSRQGLAGFEALPGNGLHGVIGGETLSGGSLRYMESVAEIGNDLKDAAEKLAEEGKTPLLFALGGRLLGLIAVADVIKKTSAGAIRALQNMGIRVVMLTGDNEKTAKAIGREAGVDHVIAGVLPDGKESVIRTLREKGKVAMVGDGINDAPALTRADVGIAIGAGTDVALDAADVVLMKSDLSDVPAAIRLSRATLRNIHENLFWAFIYNVIGIPMAAGLFGWKLDPMFAALAMSLSSFFVVSNALRLNLVKVHEGERDRKLKKQADISSLFESAENQASVPAPSPEGGEGIRLVLKIGGMMCEHCEAAVSKALLTLPEVTGASADHEKGLAWVTASSMPDPDEMKKKIADEDYELLGFSREDS